MRQRIDLPITAVRVPSKRLRTLEPAKVEIIAEDMLENGQTTPIQVRADKQDSYVLIEGLHRLEALKSLGEETIAGYLVHARLR